MKIGFWELVVVVIVAFVFIGPDQLPVYAKKIGKMLRELKKYTGAASEEIQKLRLRKQPRKLPRLPRQRKPLFKFGYTAPAVVIHQAISPPRGAAK